MGAIGLRPSRTTWGHIPCPVLFSYVVYGPQALSRAILSSGRRNSSQRQSSPEKVKQVCSSGLCWCTELLLIRGQNLKDQMTSKGMYGPYTILKILWDMVYGPKLSASFRHSGTGPRSRLGLVVTSVSSLAAAPPSGFLADLIQS